MKKLKSNPTQTTLTICVGFLFIYIVGHKKYDVSLDWSLGISIAVGIIGIVSPYLSRKIEWIWFKIAELLGYIMPNVILSIVYYLLLVPLAFLSKLFGKKDPLGIKNTQNSMFKDVDKTFDSKSMENPW